MLNICHISGLYFWKSFFQEIQGYQDFWARLVVGNLVWQQFRDLYPSLPLELLQFAVWQWPREIALGQCVHTGHIHELSVDRSGCRGRGDTNFTLELGSRTCIPTHFLWPAGTFALDFAALGLTKVNLWQLVTACVGTSVVCLRMWAFHRPDFMTLGSIDPVSGWPIFIRTPKSELCGFSASRLHSWSSALLATSRLLQFPLGLKAEHLRGQGSFP